MFGLITEKRHNKIVTELINDHTSTIEELVKIGDDLNVKLESCQQRSDSLSKYIIELQSKVEEYQNGYQYGLANHRINLHFYYSHNYGTSFNCRVTFTPLLFDSTSNSFTKPHFGWKGDGTPIPEDIEVMEQLFKEMAYNVWHWSDADKKPAACFSNHDIAAITEAVGKFNDELQHQVDNILKAEQYRRIARATEPEESEN